MSLRPSKFKIQTYGCKVNTYDTGLLQSRLEKRGYKSTDDLPEVHIINTCAVTDEATQSAAKDIRKLKIQSPNSTVVVTGCAAQVDTDVFTDLPQVDLIVANSHKDQLEKILDDHFKGVLSGRVFKSNIFRHQKLGTGGGLEKGHTRAFLKIQDGCDSFCTFCVIPYARGTSRSLPMFDLIDRINDLYDQGYREVVLTGVHIGDYLDEVNGRKLKLEDLVESILKSTSMPRIRLSSLEPPELSERLLELYTDPKMCAHFHMSIQSATSQVLGDMKRQYLAEDVERSLWTINKKIPHAFVGMDVIVGFPTESQEAFTETYHRLKDLPWSKIHVFPYSQRPGTRASVFEESVYPHIRKERSKKLRELSSDRYAAEALKQVGETCSVMVLNTLNRNHIQHGVADNYWPVTLDGKSKDLRGQITDVRITGYNHSSHTRGEGVLLGQVIDGRLLDG